MADRIFKVKINYPNYRHLMGTTDKKVEIKTFIGDVKYDCWHVKFEKVSDGGPSGFWVPIKDCQLVDVQELGDGMINLKGNIKTGVVFLNGMALSPERSLKIRNHSPRGFSWGYGGSGPAQLGLAILLEFLPENEAVSKYQDFKWKVIANLPKSDIDINLDISDLQCNQVDHDRATEGEIQ
jgi:hypothetical protein